MYMFPSKYKTKNKTFCKFLWILSSYNCIEVYIPSSFFFKPLTKSTKIIKNPTPAVTPTIIATVFPVFPTDPPTPLKHEMLSKYSYKYNLVKFE